MKNNIYVFLILLITSNILPQTVKSKLNDDTFTGLELRNIGPAFMSGRIADIAIHPENENIWYVAVGSGGVWKTTNSGTTWEPIFDDYTSYSTGSITIDSNNPNILWLGTGENIGGRHVGYGDGIYKSLDGGKSWNNMGLKDSEHISKIIVHPENSDIVYVASQGPLWRSGGDRGLYKTSDGGNNWVKLLGDEKWTGATDIIMDPRNPDILYAATWQRHRNVAAVIDGGPGTALYKTQDGGKNWAKLKKGLPETNMGKIGLAISPQKPDVLYAAIELERRKGGVFKSTDQGASWIKQSDAVAGATGPHYYQELYACPHKFDRIYLADARMQYSEDGGKTFNYINEKFKHPDNHALVFRKNDPEYLLIGTDGGLYESFDLRKTWKHVANLPVTQFYKVALDDAEPFYNIVGGTQDNNTQLGPSRTDNVQGITNRNWIVTLYGDGHQPATEPGNPDIIYSEWQEGNLTRIDRKTGEIVYIQPQPEEGDPAERFNWDSPILVSPHKTTRLYFASQRVWRSEDRGDSWTPISRDLTRNQERLNLPIMGKKQSWDEAWDFDAMSVYNTITSLAESPLQEGLIYAGTDDGLLNITEDGGTNWRRIEAGDLPGVPETAFVNDIKADLFEVNTVYVVLDNHKYGDFNPYIVVSKDRGRSWKSLRSNLPPRTLLWRLVQDHVKKELLFLGTEFGIYFSLDAGKKWIELKGGVPTISFRDLAIQKRENDLVGASFGRGFFIFDDYSVLREVSEKQLNEEAALFSTRKAWWYIPQPDIAFGTETAQGNAFYRAPNPPFGAVFTYYLSEDYKTSEMVRKQKEKELREKDRDIEFPGWENIEKERRESDPKIWLTVKDKQGNILRNLEGPAKKGFHRIAWDLRLAPNDIVSLKETDDDEEDAKGILVVPGEYNVTLSREINGVITQLSGPVTFEVERLRAGALKGSTEEVMVSFLKDIHSFKEKVNIADNKLQKAIKRIGALKRALVNSQVYPSDLSSKLQEVWIELNDLDEVLNGNRSKRDIGEIRKPNISRRLSAALRGTSDSTYGPTPNLKKTLEIAKKQFEVFKVKLDLLLNSKLPALELEMQDAGAPWVEGGE